jgi:hypothetical protein
MKDDTHPIKLVRNNLNLIGGNWIGKTAEKDIGPIDTLKREIYEELSFDRPNRDSIELSLLDLAEVQQFDPSRSTNLKIPNVDIMMLDELKNALCNNIAPFGMFKNTVTKEALLTADLESTRDGFASLVCYYASPLEEEWWRCLLLLQGLYRNISSECLSVITCLEEIVSQGQKIAFGHDQVVQNFFLSYGFREAKKISLVGKVLCEPKGTPMASYSDILECYNVKKRP